MSFTMNDGVRPPFTMSNFELNLDFELFESVANASE